MENGRVLLLLAQHAQDSKGGFFAALAHFPGRADAGGAARRAGSGQQSRGLLQQAGGEAVERCALPYAARVAVV